MSPHHLRRVRRSILRQRKGNSIVNLPAYFARMAAARVAVAFSQIRDFIIGRKMGDIDSKGNSIIRPGSLLIPRGPRFLVGERTGSFDMPPPRVTITGDPRTGRTIVEIVKPEPGKESTP